MCDKYSEKLIGATLQPVAKNVFLKLNYGALMQKCLIGLWRVVLETGPKKDGDYRPVVDFRHLNQCTETQRYPLPIMTDLLHSLGEHNSVFSSLDLMSGFWQIPLAPESRPLTAFSTPSGHFQYLRLPMGLKNFPVVFQLLINEVFSGLLGNGVFAYLDDVIIASKNMTSHFVHFHIFSHDSLTLEQNLSFPSVTFWRRSLLF